MKKALAIIGLIVLLLIVAPIIVFFIGWFIGWLVSLVVGGLFVEGISFLGITLTTTNLPVFFGAIGVLTTFIVDICRLAVKIQTESDD